MGGWGIPGLEPCESEQSVAHFLKKVNGFATIICHNIYDNINY